MPYDDLEKLLEEWERTWQDGRSAAFKSFAVISLVLSLLLGLIAIA